MNDKLFKLNGKVQHYAWGGRNFIPQLLHINNSEGKPFAEYWMGSHVNASSEIIFSDGSRVSLFDYIHSFPEATLGPETFSRFGSLPYLLKILDVKDMLSIQVHPSKKNAKLEYEEENRKGIPLTASHRNYKDENHKPELMLALGDFWLLHGFKPKDKLINKLGGIPELQFLISYFENGGYRGLYKKVMEMDQAEVNRILQTLTERVVEEYRKNRLEKNQEDFWAARAAETYNLPDKIDRGIFSIYLFNLVHVLKGEVIFQDAGLPHAYLEGQNVELMANSDNVLRGGLTPKHIDVKELLKHILFEETHPRPILEERSDEAIGFYSTPAPDFRLSRIEIDKGEKLSVHSQSAEIYFVMEGELILHEGVRSFTRNKGEAFIGFDQADFTVQAAQNSLIYRASVPV